MSTKRLRRIENLSITPLCLNSNLAGAKTLAKKYSSSSGSAQGVKLGDFTSNYKIVSQNLGHLGSRIMDPEEIEKSMTGLGLTAPCEFPMLCVDCKCLRTRIWREKGQYVLPL